MSKLNELIPPSEEIFQRVWRYMSEAERNTIFIYSVQGIHERGMILMGANAYQRYNGYKIEMIHKYWHKIVKDLTFKEHTIILNENIPSHYPNLLSGSVFLLQQAGINNYTGGQQDYPDLPNFGYETIQSQRSGLTFTAPEDHAET